VDLVIELNVSDSLVSSALTAQYATQRAGEIRPFSLDMSQVSVSVWQALVAVETGSLVRPTDDNATGFVYQAPAAGQTDDEEPAWGASLAQTTQDGSILWTTLAPPAVGQDTIASASWDQESPPDAALTISSVVNTPLSANALVGGGTQGQTYLVVVSVTMTSGTLYKQPIYVNVV
jgi:hypothetical protein